MACCYLLSESSLVSEAKATRPGGSTDPLLPDAHAAAARYSACRGSCSRRCKRLDALEAHSHINKRRKSKAQAQIETAETLKRVAVDVAELKHNFRGLSGKVDGISRKMDVLLGMNVLLGTVSVALVLGRSGSSAGSGKRGSNSG